MQELFYKTAAFVILAVFYGCYLTKMMLQRRKGIRTDQIGKGKTGFVKAIELTMKAATCLVLLVEVFSILFLKQMPAVPVRIAGILLSLGLTFCMPASCLCISTGICLRFLHLPLSCSISDCQGGRKLSSYDVR